MRKTENALLAALMVMSLFVFYNLTMLALDMEERVIAAWIFYPFYALAFLTPPFMLMRWMRNRTFLQFQRFILSVLPAFLFLLFMLAILFLLEDMLTQF